MDIICAWCGKKIGKKDSKGVEGKTHASIKTAKRLIFPTLLIVLLWKST